MGTIKAAIREAGWAFFTSSGSTSVRVGAAARALRRSVSRRPRPTAGVVASVLGERSVTVLDVGARWGTEGAWFAIQPLASVVGFEPDGEECARLNADAAPWQRFVPVALRAEDGARTLFVTAEPGCSSLYRPDPRVLERFPAVRESHRVVRRMEVAVRRLDAWAREAALSEAAFLKLDVQGAELDVLRGGEELLSTCLGLELEVEFSAMYEGQPVFADVDAFLRQRGFELWRLEHLVHYSERHGPSLTARSVAVYDDVKTFVPAGDGRLTWANAVYFRHHRSLPRTADGYRKRLVLAALLDAARDADGAQASIAAALELAPPDAPAAHLATLRRHVAELERHRSL